MQTIINFLPYIQIAIAVLLIAVVLLQQTGSGLGEAFGGSGGDAGFHTRRGFEKILFQSTILLGVLFVLFAIVAILFQ